MRLPPPTLATSLKLRNSEVCQTQMTKSAKVYVMQRTVQYSSTFIKIVGYQLVAYDIFPGFN